MEKKVTLQDEKILDSWSILVEKAQAKTEETLNSTTSFIKESQAPGIEIETVKVRPSWLKGLFWHGKRVSDGD